MTLTEFERLVREIRQANKEAERARQNLDRLCRKGRDIGLTWTELGYALGISAQGAQKRYGKGPERSEAQKEAQAARRLKRLQKRRAEAKVSAP